MEFFDLFIFWIIKSSLLTDLIIEEANICLVLAWHNFFFWFNFVEWLMKIFHFAFIHISWCLDSIHQLFYSCLSLFKPINIVCFNSLKLTLLRLCNFVLLFYELLKLLSLCFQGIYHIFKTILHFLNILGMNFCKSLFQRVKFHLVFSFYFINLLLEYVNLFIHLFSLFLSLCIRFFQLPQKPLDFVIFNTNKLTKSIHLNIEKLRLIFLRFMNIFKFKIEKSLELLLHLFNFIIFFLNSSLTLWL